MATHSSIFAWKIPWTEEPGRLQFMGSQKVGHDWGTEDTHARPEVSKLFMSDLPGYVSGHACTHTCTHFYINEIMRYTLLHILLFKFIIHIFYILSYSKSCIAFHNLDRPSLLYISFLLVGIWFVFCLFFFFFPIVNNAMVIIFTMSFCSENCQLLLSLITKYTALQHIKPS